MLAGCLVERRLRSVRDGRAAATAWTEGAVALVLVFAGLLFAAIAVT
jgi:CHASE2 domain-containing sensor protein